MSFTTESSDWNLSPKPRLPHSLLNIHDARPSITPTETTSISHDVEHSSALPSPQHRIPSPTTIAPVLANRILPSSTLKPDATTQTHPPATPLLTGDVSQIDQNTPEWEAARESVLSQMVTSQDLDANPAPSLTRGGIKTGGRRGRGHGRPRIKIEAPSGEPTQARSINRGGRPRGSRAGSISARGVNRGGRPRGSRAGLTASSSTRPKKRRKNALGDTEDEADNTSASEEISLPTQSRSGRKITQITQPPLPLAPPNGILKRPSATSTPLLEPPLPKKRKRAPGAAAVCINCGRGHGPSSNMIVFCDTCNTPYHQHCHTRPISPSVVQIESKEWNCADCSTLAQERAYVAGKVAAGEGMSLGEKRTYFAGLDKGALIAMLLRASNLYPELPVFDPPGNQGAAADITPLAPTPARPTPIPAIEAAASHSTMSAHPAPPPPGAGVPHEEPEDTVFEIYVEPEEPLPYPQPGNGLVLPPEEDDKALLVDEDVVSYSHSWMQGGAWMGAMAGVGMGWGESGRGMGLGVGA